MVRKHLLEMLIRHSKLARDQAASEAAGARRLSQQAESTLQTLQGYRRDYDLKSPKQQQRTPIEPALVKRHESFVGTLELALGEQTAQQGRLARATTEKIVALSAQQCRLKAFETLLQRQAHAERTRAARLDQTTTDEQASRSRRQSTFREEQS